MKKENSNFRNWVRTIWVENCFEHDGFNTPAFSMKEYFQQYKYWLKREYRHQIGKQTKS